MDVVVIKIFPTRHEAESARELLARQGIQALIEADDCAGQLSSPKGVRVLVHKKDAERSQSILSVIQEH